MSGIFCISWLEDICYSILQSGIPGGGGVGSYFAAIVGPVEQGLALSGSAIEVAGGAMFAELGDVSSHGSPAHDLAMVVGASAAHVVAAIPLEPAARIFVPDPTFFPPVSQRF